MIKRYSD
jgi:hypothetical protein